MNFDLCFERTLTVGVIIINPWMFMQIQIFKSTKLKKWKKQRFLRSLNIVNYTSDVKKLNSTLYLKNRKI